MTREEYRMLRRQREALVKEKRTYHKQLQDRAYKLAKDVVVLSSTAANPHAVTNYIAELTNILNTLQAVRFELSVGRKALSLHKQCYQTYYMLNKPQGSINTVPAPVAAPVAA